MVDFLCYLLNFVCEHISKFKQFPLISAKLPKWFGERPGKKAGDPDSPDDEEEAAAEAPVN